MVTELEQKPSFVPVDVMTITDLDTLKVLADPLRLRIRELMTEPCTVKQVAAELDIPPTKLYYHINLLEKHGLIVVVDTRIVSGIIEKQYQVSARSVRVARALLSPSGETGDESMNLTMNTLIEDMRTDLRDSMHSDILDMSEDAPSHRGVTVSSWRLALTDEQAADFHARLNELFREFRDLSEQQRDQKDVGFFKTFFTFFPSSRRHRPDEDKH